MDFLDRTASNLIFMGAIQSNFFALVLLSIREGGAKSNRYLAVLLIALSMGFISVFGILGAGQTNINLLCLMMAASLSCVPLLYIYVKVLIFKELRFTPTILFHFFPVFLAILFLLAICWPSHDYLTKLNIDLMTVIMGIWILFICPYLFSIYQMMKKHRRRIAETYHKTRTISEHILYELRVYFWVRSLLVACSIYWFITIVSIFYHEIKGFYFLIILISTATVYVIGYVGIKKPDVFLETTGKCYEKGDFP